MSLAPCASAADLPGVVESTGAVPSVDHGPRPPFPLEQIEGIWVPTVMTMTTKKGKQTLHKTILRTSNVKFNQDLDFDSFTVRGLETGP